jgi:hypothetical protein
MLLDLQSAGTLKAKIRDGGVKKTRMRFRNFSLRDLTNLNCSRKWSLNTQWMPASFVTAAVLEEKLKIYPVLCICYY